MSLCKDTNFKANHNQWDGVERLDRDVCLCAKIRILKQITTKKELIEGLTEMFVFVQRYEF